MALKPCVSIWNLESGNESFFAPCISATLSPDKHWYFCRNARGDVLKVPIAGGDIESVVKADIPAGESTKIGGSFQDFPGSVRFEEDGKLVFDHYLTSENVITQGSNSYEK